MMNWQVTISLLVAVAAIPAAIADTPANCTYEDIKGTWSFHLGETGFDNALDCSDSFEVKNEMTVRLTYPDVAYDEYGNQGFWTIIYNQGFEVAVGNHKYFAFSNYTTLSNKTVVSYCDSTLNGWSHDNWGNNWACYYGKKVEDKTFRVSEKPVYKMPELGDLDRKYVKNIDFINEINAKTNLWRAVHYPEMESMTLRDRLQRAGGIPKYGRFSFPSVSTADEKTRLAASALPTSFDWRNVNGRNLVSPIRNQGSCGSCYAFASMAMLEARIRIMTNNRLTPVFSTQDIMGCSEYSQGCAGGFPYLIAGKYGQDFGIVEEECFPYLGRDTKCTEKPGCLRWRTTDYRYVGGYFGACSEEAMLVELINNGPISVAFEVTSDFQAYKGGIYHQTGLQDGFNPWKLTNHAVLVVGYGEEDGTKFWIVKNSWGEKWGEEGFFRIMRDTDELAIESMAIVATPVLP